MIYAGIVYLFQKNHVYSQPKRAKYRITFVIFDSLLGHTVKLIAPQFVKPYVKTNKNAQADSEAICEAVARPNMRFVPIKTAEQQDILFIHRVM